MLDGHRSSSPAHPGLDRATAQTILLSRALSPWVINIIIIFLSFSLSFPGLDRATAHTILLSRALSHLVINIIFIF